MAELVETVKIQKGSGYAIINKADFDPQRHKLYAEKPIAPDQSAQEPQDGAAEQGKGKTKQK